MKKYHFDSWQEAILFFATEVEHNHREHIKAIELALRLKLDEVKLSDIHIKGEELITSPTVPKSQFKILLTKALEYFESVEDYEFCSHIKKLIKKVK